MGKGFGGLGEGGIRSDISVAEPILFIFGSDSGSTFVHNFGSGSSSRHILPLKTVQ